MSVILNETNDLFLDQRNKKRCTLCDRCVYYPFMRWDVAVGGGILICSPCVQKHKRGIVTDLIHLAAIADLRQHETSTTLKRELL